jgi:hypothetical protein
VHLFVSDGELENIPANGRDGEKRSLATSM